MHKSVTWFAVPYALSLIDPGRLVSSNGDNNCFDAVQERVSKVAGRERIHRVPKAAGGQLIGPKRQLGRPQK